MRPGSKLETSLLIARLILIVAVLIRGLVPTGYMPALSDGGGFALTICGGDAHGPSVDDIAERLGLQHEGGDGDEAVPSAPCPYVVAGGVVLPTPPAHAEPAPRAPPLNLPLPDYPVVRGWSAHPPLPPRSPPDLV